MLELLKIFEAAASRKVNLDKSTVFFSKNKSSDVKDSILGMLEMRMSSDNNLYLGLPNTIGHNKPTVFGSLKDKIRAQIQGWDSKWFSGAGK